METNESKTEESRRLVQDMYEAVKRGDTEGIFSCMSPDLIVREPAFLPYGGTYHGHEGLAVLFGKMEGLVDIGGFCLDRLLAVDDRVIGMVYLPFADASGGITLAEESVIRDGKIAELRIFVHDMPSAKIQRTYA